MNLTINQSEELLQIIQKNQNQAIGSQFGLDFLTDNDIERLEASGIDVMNLYSEDADAIFTSFNLGMLSEALGIVATKLLTYKQLREYIKGGHYIPFTAKEKFILDNIKRQAFNDVKALNGRIFKDVNQILLDNSIEAQQQFLADELKTGIAKKETVRKIANRIAEKTGDWSRDFDRIVEYASNTAFENGKVEMIERSYGEDALMWRRTYNQACKHCIRLYLTNGVGSQPKVFTLKYVKANGSNIGRKSADWLAVIGSTHPFCRCSWNFLPKGYKWNPETKFFDIPDKPPMKRKPIRIIVGGKESYV